MDCAFLALEYEISTIPLQAESAFLESGEESFFAKIKRKIREIIENFKAGLRKLFGKNSEETEKKAKEAMEKDPSLKKKKFKMPDFHKLSKLNRDTARELGNAKSKEDVDKKMASYRKKRAAILGATVLVSAAGIIGWNKHMKGQRQQAVEEVGKICEATTEKCEKMVVEEAKKPEPKPSTPTKPAANPVPVVTSIKPENSAASMVKEKKQSLVQQLMAADTEVLKNQTEDVTKEAKMSDEACKNLAKMMMTNHFDNEDNYKDYLRVDHYQQTTVKKNINEHKRALKNIDKNGYAHFDNGGAAKADGFGGVRQQLKFHQRMYDDLEREKHAILK